jgi:hypothetical protein
LGPQPSGRLPSEQISPPYAKVIMAGCCGTRMILYEPVAPERKEQSGRYCHPDTSTPSSDDAILASDAAVH